MNIREPLLHTVAIRDLRPTQMTVGMREVHAKRKAWAHKLEREGPEKGAEFLASHMIPVILGANERAYVIDHHHLARALIEEGQKHVVVTVIKNLSHLEPESFWFVMDNHSWLHPFDDKGRRRTYSELPKSIKALVDDPFRSLAGELRHIGGYAKDTTPFSEFLWADFLRRKLTRKEVDADFDGALEKALKFAKSEKADYLPGWCGAVVR
jgi:hypothetical protein